MKDLSWNLKLLFKSDNDPEIAKEHKKIELENNKFIRKWKTRSDYLKNPTVLKQALDEYENLIRYFGVDGKEGYYFWLRFHQDQVDPKIKAKYNQVEELRNKRWNELQFFELSISKIDPKLQKKFLTDKALEPYKHYLEKLFTKGKYLLSEAEERIINLKEQTAYSNWVKMVSGFLAKEYREVNLEDGSKKPQNYQELLTLINSQKKKIRDGAALAFNDILSKYSEVATEEMNSVLGYKKTDDDLRKYPRPESARHQNDDIQTETVDNLVSTVSKNFKLAERYYKLKANLLGLKKLEYHERNVEYGKLDKEFTWGDGVSIVKKVLDRLDLEFREIFEEYLKKGQIDVYPKKGKWGGAFCVDWLITHPTFLLLNYTNRLLDVITLAHEFGHGLNNELIKQKQHALYYKTPVSTAEIASIFMEDWVLDEIAKEADDEIKLALNMERLNREVSSLFRQIACYMFEQELHAEYRKKGYLSTKEIGKLFQKHMSSYMGKFVEQSSGSENWWVYWSNIRTYFYNYAYAGGILIAKQLQKLVRDDPKNIEKVKYFLSSGLSKSPKQIFKDIGIDISKKEFWENGLREFEKSLDETERLARKLKKFRLLG